MKGDNESDIAFSGQEKWQGNNWWKNKRQRYTIVLTKQTLQQ